MLQLNSTLFYRRRQENDTGILTRLLHTDFNHDVVNLGFFLDLWSRKKKTCSKGFQISCQPK